MTCGKLDQAECLYGWRSRELYLGCDYNSVLAHMRIVSRLALSALAIVPTVSVATASFAVPLECVIAKKYSCSVMECKAVSATVINRIDLRGRTYARCDARGCDTYDAVVTVAGVMVTIDVPGRGMFARMTADGSEFVEVVSLLTSTLVSYGSCR